ncbi:spore germination protein [Paenibacillus sp. MER TA 81-3]|uniref:spore germination protein n=1 Tax=Paenibacillus sp. MER TA 81-3 TaxID=2939573 RepID=UPI00203B5577|nr:spore germination protein [Paenibacillus sp. MER TA 81-3]MCM3339191.1 spore germination protein [Paenibacillus sp. MER TA 81-3]
MTRKGVIIVPSAMPLQEASDANMVWSSEGKENVKNLENIFYHCSDIVFFAFSFQGGQQASLIYVDGMVDNLQIDEHVIEPLVTRYEQDSEEDGVTVESVRRTLTAVKVKTHTTMQEVVELMLSGMTILIPHQSDTAFSIEAIQFDKRSVTEPDAESVVRGPRDGFVETMQSNTSLLRRRIRSPKLKIQPIKRGKLTHTTINLVYMEGLASEQLLEEVKRRLDNITLESILDSGYVEQCLEDNPYSPFPQLLTTERPDVASSHLLEGRVVILVDGSPVALIAPALWVSFLQSPEDYYERHFFGTIVRWLRYASIFVALLGPSIYVAVISYHQEMIPTALILTMAKARTQVPFPALVEALLMELMFEALREAGARLPKQVGSAVSIVGALVIGQAAISAGLVSAPMVMVVAITGVASFIVPHYNLGISVRLLRFPIILLSGFLGLIGTMMGFILLVTHLLTLKSFGVPYLTGVAPFRSSMMKDILIRQPVWVENMTKETDQMQNAEQSSDKANQGNGLG